MKQQNLDQNDKGNAKDTNAKNVNGKKSNWWVPQAPPTNLPFFQPKFSLPDKNVASQVLMYRQLLHTSCRPGLRLSRPYEGTVAQKAVLHMPWWERGIEDSGKMVITYDNLIVRLWMHGAILPFADLMGTPVDAMIGEDGLPPIPHPYWVDRLGFQQPDPVTDFRSGGVLSLALMVHMVESCMPTSQRFHPGGDTEVLPFGITCINVTDMLAKFLMLAKATDKVQALMSQKPFWRMFADPNAILALQELSIQMLCNVVVEMNRERRIPSLRNAQPDIPGGSSADDVYRPVTVFDFADVLERTERRVRDDLLGAGPKTVDELRAIFLRLETKYQQQLEQKERRSNRGSSSSLASVTTSNVMDVVTGATNIASSAVVGATNMAGSAVVGATNIAGSAVTGATNIAGSAVAGASTVAVGVFESIKNTTNKFSSQGSFSNPIASSNNLNTSASEGEIKSPMAASATETATNTPVAREQSLDDLLNTPIEDILNSSIGGVDGWTGVTSEDGELDVSKFLIDDDEDVAEISGLEIS